MPTPRVFPAPAPTRTGPDRCPGTLRPWPAADGLLVRLRVPGGQLPTHQLLALSRVAQTFGDGRVHLTSRANLQVRGLPGSAQGVLPDAVVGALAATGLLPSLDHDLIRNAMASPGTGLGLHGLLDLRPIVAELDRLLLADPVVVDLPGRFLMVLDDGTGDLAARTCDVGAVALDGESAQLRLGDRYGPVVPWELVPATLVGLARTFLSARVAAATPGAADAAWHLAELESADVALDHPLARSVPPDVRLPAPRSPLPYGSHRGRHGPLEHLAVGATGLGPDDVLALVERTDHLVITPWKGLLLPAPSTKDLP